MTNTLLLMYSTHTPSASHIAAVARRVGEANVWVARSEAEAIRHAPNADIICGHRYLRQVLPFAGRLKWVQSTASGIDHLPLAELAAQGVTLTRTTEAGATIARHAYTLMWMLLRGLHRSYQNQLSQHYEKAVPMLPEPRSALVLGTGEIGSQFAALLQRDGVRVTGVNRSGNVPAGFDNVVTSREWHEMLPHCDVLLLALPANALRLEIDTLQRLPAHALVLNVGRADSLDLQGLSTLLHEGRLGGAALDVVPEDTYHDGSPVWSVPNLLLTPHIAAHALERPARLEAFVEQQLDRYLDNEPLIAKVAL